MIVSVFTDDVDHINLFGAWHKGSGHTDGPCDDPQGTVEAPLADATFEKVRSLTSDVAVVQASSVQTAAFSQAGPTLGTYVLQKQQGRVW